MTALYRYRGPRANRRELLLDLEHDHETQLWLMRMCYGEGGRKCSAVKASALLWAMVNRWFLHPGRAKWGSFERMLRLFSQPINPRWQRGGDLAIKYAGTEFATEQKLKRRKRVCALTSDDIPDNIYSAVINFSKGLLFPPLPLTRIAKSRISNWASLKSTPKKYPWGVDIAGDWFFEDRELVDGEVFVMQNDIRP